MSKKVIVVNTEELLTYLSMSNDDAVAEILEPPIRYLCIYLVAKALDDSQTITPDEINTVIEENVKIALSRILKEVDYNLGAVVDSFKKEFLQ